MELSILDLFKVGLGPSSSHTVGPMRAAFEFLQHLTARRLLTEVARVQIDLFGSLALTGRGHATDKAVLLGLSGAQPDSIEPDAAERLLAEGRSRGIVQLAGHQAVSFVEARDLVFHMKEFLPTHPNGMKFSAWAGDGTLLFQETYFSVGGGFIMREGADANEGGLTGVTKPVCDLPYPFSCAEELLAMGQRAGLSIAEMVRRNESVWRSDAETEAALDHLWLVMQQAIERGCHADGLLPGRLQVRRRAGRLYRELQERGSLSGDPLDVLDWVSLFALAVGEENAAGGRIVTAPTNGAAGVVPAVLAYYRRFVQGATDAGGRVFLLTAGAVGMLYKTNASLSAAEMGCQGEVGVACSMAAAGLAAVLGGTNQQIENAAEIGMEHNLGLTCDPVGGLVQVPCIERNAMGAAKAINAARLAVLHGDGTHRVSLDRVIETMRQTGLDMQDKYKETSLGGLAVNVVNC